MRVKVKALGGILWVDPSSAQHGTPIKTSTTATISTATGEKTEKHESVTHKIIIKKRNKRQGAFGLNNKVFSFFFFILKRWPV